MRGGGMACAERRDTVKSEIDKDGCLRIDAQSLVQSFPDAVLRDLAKYALFDELLIAGILEGLVDGQMWQDEEQAPWWFTQETFTKLRLKLLPLLPEITAEAVRTLEADAKRARAEKNRWHDAAWKLWHAWPDKATRPEHPSWAYEHQETMTRETAEAHLRSVEAKIAEERTELERLRADVAAMRPVVDAALQFPDAYRGRLVTPPGDWACIECTPHSDMIKDDNWRCPVHALLNAIGSLKSKQAAFVEATQ
jgi:hypothetical protein